MRLLLPALLLVSAATQAQTYVYECDNKHQFVVSIEQQNAWLFLADKTVELPHIPAGSGAKYSNGNITYWTKGGEAILETKDSQYSNCRNNRAKAIWEDAKLRGIDFRATGNEPGWHLEIGENILFVNDYGNNRYQFTTPDPVSKQKTRSTEYTTNNTQHSIQIKLTGQTCQDTMVDKSYETTVVVTLDGKQYRGCGMALH